ncbi:MAG TPA: pyrroline-5-carboxylate reductase [Gemmatimonadales bacterium]|nr:pyrroline-5-carboxylate reductase [Gemmatimonadales bacterium]
MTTAGRRIAIIGAGNIGAAIARGIVDAGVVAPSAVTLTRRGVDHLAAFKAAGYAVTSDNRAAASGADVLILAVTPQQLNALLDELRGSVDAARHTVVSVVSGASIAAIRAGLGTTAPIIRAMPNTAIAVRESMTCLATDAASHDRLAIVKTLFGAVGQCVVISEDLMVPATALCACSVAFFLRAIRAASQGGIEIGFHSEESLLMAAQTARGAATLLVKGGTHPESEVDKVTTPQGCTISGLNEMEHNGFSSALIKGITTAADKAAELYAPR